MGNQNNKTKHDDLNRQTPQNDTGNARSAGQQTRQIDDNQDDMGRDVNNPSKTTNEINKGM